MDRDTTRAEGTTMKKEGIPGDPEVAKRLKQARVGANLTQAQLADRVSALVGSIISRSIISRTEKAERDAETRLVWAVAQVTGETMDWLLEPLNKIRDLDRAIPGLHNRDTLRDRLSRRILKTDHTESFHCFDCLLDPDFHVLAEWLAPAGQVPGQTEFIIDIEKMLEDVA
jgi:transcriptional regulator with XRE-family HTH domain